MSDLTIKDLLVAMTAMEERLRTDVQESAKVVQQELRIEIQESAKVVQHELRAEIQQSAKVVQHELRAEIQQSAKVVQNELRTEIQESQTTALGAIHDLASHMDSEFEKVRAEMATKDFVERRLEATEERITQNLGGRIDSVDAKVGRLVDVFEKKDVLTVKDAHHIVTGA